MHETESGTIKMQVCSEKENHFTLLKHGQGLSLYQNVQVKLRSRVFDTKTTHILSFV